MWRYAHAAQIKRDRTMVTSANSRHVVPSSYQSRLLKRLSELRAIGYFEVASLLD
jgi:hypothetical protein